MIQITENLTKEYCGVVRITGSDAISKDDYMSYNNNVYVENVKIFGYNFSTSDMQNQLFNERNIQLYTTDGIKTLNYLLYNPVLIFGCDLSLRHFSDIEFNVVEGRMYENDDECVITKNSKRINENWNYLNVGDKITFEIPGLFYKKFMVVGILEEDPYNDTNTNARFIYTTYESAEHFQHVRGDKHAIYYIIGAEHGPKRQIRIGYDALFYLKDHNDFYNFRNDVFTQSNFTRFIEPLFDNFDTIKNLLSNMQAWCMLFMVLTVFIIIFITIMATIILLNSRKYEMAVLRSVGMKKSRLIINYFIENLVFIWGTTMISIVSAQFILRLFTNNVFADIRDLISAESFENLIQGRNFGLLMQNAGIVFGGTTTVVILSLVLVCVNIIRFEPLKIFNKQY
jgi:hypothetical protein